MRIPISVSDLQQGRLTKISRILAKRWPAGTLSLMQAQNTLAGLLGYRDLHDLQSNAEADISAPGAEGLTRADVVDAVAWRLSRRHHLPLGTAQEFAVQLHLQSLDIDALTAEAATERVMANWRHDGRLLVLDEFHQYVNPYWNPKTPQLLDANIPGFRFAVLADRRMFLWNRLDHLMRHLPASFVDDLSQEVAYGSLSTGKAEEAFYTTELFPAACLPVSQAVKESEILPDGFEIVWLFNGGSRCLGRVLFNKTLGGIIPVIFDPSDDSIFEAVAALLCGDTVPLPAHQIRGAGRHVFRLHWGRGYDLARDVGTLGRKSSDGRPSKKRDLARLDGEIRYGLVDGRPVLKGATFVEREQVYLRVQSWLGPDDIPTCLRSPWDVKPGSALLERRNSNEVILPAACVFFLLARDKMAAMVRDASVALTADVDRLLASIRSLTTPSAFSAYSQKVVDWALPLRVEDQTEDDPDLVDERDRAIEALKWRGRALHQLIPALDVFDAAALGMVLLDAEGEYPGSDGADLVYPPKADDIVGIVTFLAGMVLHAACCASGGRAPEASLLPGSVILGVDLLLKGHVEPADLAASIQQISVFRRALSTQEDFLKGIEAWRSHDDRMIALRSEGRFLYVGSPVDRVRPKSFAELSTDMLSRFRKSGSAVVTQDTAIVSAKGAAPKEHMIARSRDLD
ncbi:MAG: hypothetical protein F8N36_14095 [Desulfovibrio sp.]|uniref:hypothetical protein n=1 Tax=Desulfovibrio sp. TaxID=885 RepID=UPI00135E9928|nr:hypothetical protein [Desulfovibrio sp.]MTJ93970.1 hypothetical protein [Desulfovibrio sp.]